MGLKCGIIGLSKSGKTTLFNCMSNYKVEVDSFSTSTKSNQGFAIVADKRLDLLDSLVKAEKKVYTNIELIDIPGLIGGAEKNSTRNLFLSDIRLADALILVVRCYDDDKIPHVEGSVDPVRDKDIIDLELQVKDLEQIEKKIIKVEKASKIGDKSAKVQLETLMKFKHALENLQNIRDLDLNEIDKVIVNELMFLTAKPVIYVCNIDENAIKNGNKYVNSFIDYTKKENTVVIPISAAIEADIASFENQEERELFLQELGIAEPGVDKLSRAAHEILQSITFFTIGGKENRAWTIKKGMNAQQAAGVIHSDLERGFIRAEVISFDDFSQLKSEQACKEKGKNRLEGKNYIVQDGDIMHVRFNV